MSATFRTRRRSTTTEPSVSPFEPVTALARYEPPAAVIDPDTTKTWLRRALPIMKAHKGIFLTSLILSFVGLILQVQIPQLQNHTIDN